MSNSYLIFLLAEVDTTFTSYILNLQLRYSNSSTEIEWTLPFGPNSLALTAKGLFTNFKISFQETPSLNSAFVAVTKTRVYLPLARKKHTQRETMEITVKVLSTVGAQKMDCLSAMICERH